MAWTTPSGGARRPTTRETGFIQRERKLAGATFLQAPVFAWLENPSAIERDLRERLLTWLVSTQIERTD